MQEPTDSPLFVRQHLQSHGLSPADAKALIRSLGLAEDVSLDALTMAQREQLDAKLIASDNPPVAAADGPGAENPAEQLRSKLLRALSSTKVRAASEQSQQGIGPIVERVRLLAQRYALLLRSWELTDAAEAPRVGGELTPDLIRKLMGGMIPADRRILLERCESELASLSLVDQLKGSKDVLGIRFQMLCEKLDLGPAGANLLAVFVAMEVDPHLAWSLHVLGRGEQLGSLSRLFLLHLLDGLTETETELRDVVAALDHGSPLARYRVLSEGPPGVLGLNSMVSHFVLGASRELPWDFLGVGELSEPKDAIAHGRRLFEAKLIKLVSSGLEDTGTVLFSGSASADNWPLCCAATKELGAPVFRVRVDELITRALDPDVQSSEVSDLLREARLSGAVLFFEQADSLLPAASDPNSARYKLSQRIIATLALDSCRQVWELGPGVDVSQLVLLLERLDAVPLHVPLTSFDKRRETWLQCIPETLALSAARTKRLAKTLSSYPLAVEQIERAVGLIALRSGALNEQAMVLQSHRICQDLVSHRMEDLATRVRPKGQWDDLVLMSETQDALLELLAFAKHVHRLFGEWKLDRTIGRDKGISALFSGPSGTGKTMAAGLIAAELGLELFRVDLSRLVSKYVGETERQLGRLFGEATEIGAGILFDEADSLFSGRTEVRSASDKYANLEVNYLLQKMEEFEGLAILTTNFPQYIDQAFQRRIKFKVDFPKPDEAMRAELWDVLLPEETPLAKGVDFEALGERFELTGGEIKNAVLRAGVYAAESDSTIEMKHLCAAAQREMRAIGRLVRDEELAWSFGQDEG